MTDEQVTHVGFINEPDRKGGQFCSIGLVTTPLGVLGQLEEELQRLLEGSGVDVFKWNRLDSEKERLAADKMCLFAIDKASSGKLRIDVLIWNAQDWLRSAQGRDDAANWQQMYYYLLRYTLGLRWPNDAVWRLYHCDEHTATGTFFAQLKRNFRIEEINFGKSGERSLFQLADLFAGLAVFSRDTYNDYRCWLEATSQQQSLFGDNAVALDLSQGLINRFLVLRSFDEGCKQQKLGVSLRTKCGLWTPLPKNPINFWLFEPYNRENKVPSNNRRKERQQ